MKKTKSKVGRKLISDKTELVGIYLRASEIENLGGKDVTRKKIYKLLKIEVEFNIETKEHHVINCILYHGEKVWLHNSTFKDVLMEEIETFTKDVDWYKIYLDDKYKYELENVNN